MTKFSITLTVLGLFASVTLSSAEFLAKVIKVYDGDTVKVEDTDGGKYKIRFANIDAPESSQPHGPVSKAFLESFILDKEVRVFFTSIDVYGRIVGTLYLKDNTSVNAVMVQHGHAWWYKAYSKNTSFEALEKSAKKKKLGLWKDPNPQPPWEYRKQMREQKENAQ